MVQRPGVFARMFDFFLDTIRHCYDKCVVGYNFKESASQQ